MTDEHQRKKYAFITESKNLTYFLRKKRFLPEPDKLKIFNTTNAKYTPVSSWIRTRPIPDGFYLFNNPLSLYYRPQSSYYSVRHGNYEYLAANGNMRSAGGLKRELVDTWKLSGSGTEGVQFSNELTHENGCGGGDGDDAKESNELDKISSFNTTNEEPMKNFTYTVTRYPNQFSSTEHSESASLQRIRRRVFASPQVMGPTGGGRLVPFRESEEQLHWIQEPPAALTFSNSSGGSLHCTLGGVHPPPEVEWTFEDGTPVQQVRTDNTIYRNIDLNRKSGLCYDFLSL